MKTEIEVSSDIARTARVLQMEGMFDVPAQERSHLKWSVELPIEDREWNIGMIVGPSGCGKSTIARDLFSPHLFRQHDWAKDLSILDGFPPDMGTKDIVELLSSVGYSSPPGWLRPFHVLSNGEQFRVTMARLLAERFKDIVVVDEFTSVVDRTVAQIGSHAFAKVVRRRNQKFIAVTCHEDVEAWLQPDWVYRPAEQRFAWRELRRRPSVQLEIHRALHSAWGWFAPHHYLTASLHRAARCFIGTIEGRPACFAGVIPFPHPITKNLVSLSRVVVLPDFQGLGLGAYAFTESIARICATNGKILCTHPSHPALVRTWNRSEKWKMTGKPAFAVRGRQTRFNKTLQRGHATTRLVSHFMWRGGEVDENQRSVAESLWSASACQSKKLTGKKSKISVTTHVA